VTQLRAAGASSTSCLPTALLAFTRNHTQEVRLDSCAQFSVAGVELRKYGCCVTRDAPVNVVEGFGGGQVRVLGVWRFTGTTRYQQRITVDALLVDGQGDEFLIGEDWMVQKQVKMDFASRELKYRSSLAGQCCSSARAPAIGRRSGVAAVVAEHTVLVGRPSLPSGLPSGQPACR
jgi:hypothetical protein